MHTRLLRAVDGIHVGVVHVLQATADVKFDVRWYFFSDCARDPLIWRCGGVQPRNLRNDLARARGVWQAAVDASLLDQVEVALLLRMKDVIDYEGAHRAVFVGRI